MADLYLDLRNKAVRVIVAEGGAVSYGRVFNRQLTDEAVLRELLADIRRECGGAFPRAHLLLSSDEVTVSQHKTQALAIADAEMIIRRAVATATGDPEPLFRLTRMAAEQNQQVYSAEYVSRTVIERYVRMFRQAKVRLATVTTALQANQALFPKLQSEIHQVQVLFELNQEAVEAYFFTPSELLRYEVVAARRNLAEEHDASSESDAERSSRRRLYESMTLLHGLYSHFMNANPQASVEKVWLSGDGSNLPGLSDALAGGMGIPVEVVVPEEVKGLKDSQAYAALAGSVRLLASGSAVNFIPAEMLRRLPVNKRTVMQFAASCCVVVPLLVVAVTEMRYAAQKSQLNNERQALQQLTNSAVRVKEEAKQLQNIQGIIRERISFYDILKDLATRLPRETYLDEIDYKQVANGNRLILKSFIEYDSEFGRRGLLSNYLSALDSSSVLAGHDEPVITYRQQGDKKLMVIAVTCQLKPQQGTGRQDEKR